MVVAMRRIVVVVVFRPVLRNLLHEEGLLDHIQIMQELLLLLVEPFEILADLGAGVLVVFDLGS